MNNMALGKNKNRQAVFGSTLSGNTSDYVATIFPLLLVCILWSGCQPLPLNQSSPGHFLNQYY